MNFSAKILVSVAFVAVLASGPFAQQASPQQAPAPKQLPRDGFPVGPSAKILGFTASADVNPSRPVRVTLTWEVVNADRIELDQGIGIVATRDSRTVTPSATTTYSLIARGRQWHRKRHAHGDSDGYGFIRCSDRERACRCSSGRPPGRQRSNDARARAAHAGRQAGPERALHRAVSFDQDRRARSS